MVLSKFQVFTMGGTQVTYFFKWQKAKLHKKQMNMHYSNLGFEIIQVYYVSQFLKSIGWIQNQKKKKKNFTVFNEKKNVTNKTLYPYLTLKIIFQIGNTELSTKVNFGQDNISFRFCSTLLLQLKWGTAAAI